MNTARQDLIPAAATTGRTLFAHDGTVRTVKSVVEHPITATVTMNYDDGSAVTVKADSIFRTVR